jgi:PB1 domain
VDSRNTVIGIVDVLKLTYATLEQINQMNTPEGEGPMWNRFWNTLDNETESIHSNDGVHSHPPRAETPLSPVEQLRIQSPEIPGRVPVDSLVPNDSASFAAAHDRFEEGVSEVGAVAADQTFVFKFKSPAGRVHRVRFDPSLGLDSFRSALGEKLTPEEKGVVMAEGFAISFVDDEGDFVSILAEADLSESVAIAKRTGKDKVDLYIHHPSSTPRVETPPSPPKTEIAAEVVETVVQTSVSKAETKEVISGVPNELLLPGAVVILAAVIVGVFIATRAGGKMRH